MKQIKLKSILSTKNSFFIPIIVVSIIVIFEFWQIHNLIQFSRWVAHTDRVISTVHSIQMHLRDLESSGRGFSISGNREFLYENTNATEKLFNDLNIFKKLNQKNHQQLGRIAIIEPHIHKWLTFRELVVQTRTNKQDANVLIASGKGKHLMDLIMSELKTIEADESQLRDQRLVSTHLHIERSSVVGIVALIMLITWLLTLITREKRLELELRSAEIKYRTLYEKEQRAVQTREDTIAIVSHDLKNPLMAIQSGAELIERSLKTENFSGQTREKLDKLIPLILRSAGQANLLINDLLDFAKIESENFRVSLANERISPVIHDCCNDLLPSALKKGVLFYDSSSDNDSIACIDKKRMNQVLSNLIGNAIKFTPTGGEVRVQSNYYYDRVEICVSDSGPGVSKDDGPLLFERYYQPEKSRHQGTGLGLFISKAIVEAHDGKIWLESEPGEGSRFIFSLPLTRGPVTSDRNL